MTDAKEPLFGAVEEAPEDLERRAIYADWLEERGDARAEYVRLGRQILDPATPEERRREARKAAKRTGRGLDPRWVRSMEAQDRLCVVSRRLGVPVPLALRVLWREAALSSDLEGEDLETVWVPGSRGAVTLEAKGLSKSDRDEYLENEDIADAFRRIFREIDFVGCYGDGSVFGYWRYAPGVTAADAPVIYIDDSAEFHLTGATLQDHFAARDLDALARGVWDEEGREAFGQVREWFAGRGVETSPSPEALVASLKRFPSVAERFAGYCEECG